VTLSVPAQPTRPAAEARAAASLVEIARCLNSDVRPERMLEMVVRAARELLDADRASVLLLDDEGRLGPEVSIARHDDLELWTRFRDMPPIPLLVDSTARELLLRGRAVLIPHAAASTLVPSEWQHAFGLQALVIAPLLVQGRPCGALVVDDARPGHAFDATAAEALEGVAALAALVLRQSARFSVAAEQARTFEQLLSMAAALNGSPGLHRVLQTVVDAFLAAFGAVSCSVCTFADSGDIRCLASRGPGQPEPGVPDASGGWVAGHGPARDRWTVDPAATLVLPAGEAGGPWVTVLVPFSQEGRVRGFVRLGVAAGVTPSEEQLRVGVSLAGQAWLAMERATLAEVGQHRERRIDLLYGLSHEIAHLTDMRVVVERLAPPVRDATGCELIDVLLCDAEAARAFAARTPRGDVAGQVRRWRRDSDPRPGSLDGLYVVPVLVAGQVLGVLRVRAVSPALLGRDDAEFLLAVGTGIADLVCRRLLRAQLESAERQLAVVEERARVTAELQDEVGRLLVAAASRIEPLGLRMDGRDGRGALRDVQQEIVRTGRQLRAAVETLSSLHRHADDLPGSLRQMVRAWGRAAAVDTDLRVSGRVQRLAPSAEGALLRLAHEALTRVGGSSHASTVMVQLCYGAGEVELVVHDDGVHLAQRATAESRVHPALRAMQNRLHDLGGTLQITECVPQGVRLTAVVPAGPADGTGPALAPIASIVPPPEDTPSRAGRKGQRPPRLPNRTGERR
jgi:signal transduction histidine kinase